MDTFVVRLVLAVTILAWGSVLLHDLVTPDAPEEASLAPAAATERDRDDAALPFEAPAAPAATAAPTANATTPDPTAPTRR